MVSRPRSEVTAAARPLTGTGLVVQQLRPRRLLVRGRVDRVARSADRSPGTERELVEAVVAPSAVHRPRVATGLARGESGPVETVGRGGQRRTRLGAHRDLLGDRGRVTAVFMASFAVCTPSTTVTR